MIPALMIFLLVQAPDAAAQPEEAVRVRGSAQVGCEVAKAGYTDCEVISETPPDRGFGLVARRLAEGFRPKPPREGGPVVGSRAPIPFKFDMSVQEAAEVGILPPGSPPLIKRAKWVRRPIARELAGLYPRRALADRVNGTGEFLCTVREDGRLTACQSFLEAPQGYGFGEATRIAAERYFRMAPRDEEGRPTAGRPVRYRIVWQGGRG